MFPDPTRAQRLLLTSSLAEHAVTKVLRCGRSEIEMYDPSSVPSFLLSLQLSMCKALLLLRSPPLHPHPQKDVCAWEGGGRVEKDRRS